MDIPPPIQVDGVPKLEVQVVLDSQFWRRKLQFFVDWVGYDASDRSWEPADAVTNATKAVDAFHNIFLQINLVDTSSPFDRGSC